MASQNIAPGAVRGFGIEQGSLGGDFHILIAYRKVMILILLYPCHRNW
jgi:hypothetical protein